MFMGMWLAQDYIFKKNEDLQYWIKEILDNDFYKLKIR